MATKVLDEDAVRGIVRDELADFEIRFEQKLGSLRDKFFNNIDGFLKKYSDHETDHDMNQYRNDDFEKRKDKLEKIHSQNTHKFT